MKTKELCIFGLQANVISGIVEGNSAKFLLANGNTITAKCPTKQNAAEVLHTVLYYPAGNPEDNAGREFEFQIEITVQNKFI